MGVGFPDSVGAGFSGSDGVQSPRAAMTWLLLGHADLRLLLLVGAAVSCTSEQSYSFFHLLGIAL